MKGSMQVAKGRIEEAAGALVGNDKLGVKGRQDQAEGHAMQKVECKVAKVEAAAKKLVDKTKRMAKDVVDKTECIAKDAVDKAKGKA